MRWIARLPCWLESRNSSPRMCGEIVETAQGRLVLGSRWLERQKRRRHRCRTAYLDPNESTCHGGVADDLAGEQAHDDGLGRASPATSECKCELPLQEVRDQDGGLADRPAAGAIAVQGAQLRGHRHRPSRLPDATVHQILGTPEDAGAAASRSYHGVWDILATFLR